MSRIFLTSLILILILVTGIGFAALNPGPVSIDYFLGQVQTTLPWALLLSLLIGVILGGIVVLALSLRGRREIRRLRREVRVMEAELKNLRNMPIRNT